jgi:hypothetical protein
VLSVFAAVFIALTVSSYTQKSATFDEPLNVATGYAALKLADYRLHPESPPFLRMWAALPLLAMDNVRFNTNSPTWKSYARHFEYRPVAYEFLYRDNDADRLLYAARFMNVWWGILLGALIFCWARELWGLLPASLALAIYAFEPNILAHASLVTTDLGVSCFIFGATWFCWRFAREANPLNGFGLVAFFSLAQISKTSALLLLPIVVALMGLRAARATPWPWRWKRRAGTLTTRSRRVALAAAVCAVIVAAGWGSIWAVYRFRYTPSPTEAIVFPPPSGSSAVVSAGLWLDANRLLPHAYVRGFLLEQDRGRTWTAFLFGKLSDGGWWYYFPCCFLMKTSAALLAGFLMGWVCLARDRPKLGDHIYFVLPLVVGMIAAMTSRLDVGVRHILPLYPFAVMVAGTARSRLCARRLTLVALALAGLVGVESLRVWPDYLTFFNCFAGGPANGSRLLGDSNLDWGQDLKGLKRWMTHHGVPHISLAYFGTADPAYYGIDCTYLPGSPFFIPPNQLAPLRRPGYVAVSVTHLQGIYFPDEARTFYAPLQAMTPIDRIGNSIYIYWLEAK